MTIIVKRDSPCCIEHNRCYYLAITGGIDDPVIMTWWLLPS